MARNRYEAIAVYQIHVERDETGGSKRQAVANRW